ncbi:uncharacterized protein LOC104908164 isoform X3 [Beta vulgaris subsp. vulgaris]|uniref:uncharacterized protein LOC104908164 isoform X3 n=1 Tax=Beta vulgaris subsp. vulgaris TaxID=3555 RepID=UPI002036B661|nr:uncharacterized protein LOC104908164 isoform X3 [Beta vulgaris subsp. vulgaris]
MIRGSPFSRNLILKVYPAMFIENVTELAFDDITPEDPDFTFIQGLAEAGLISSKLSRHDMLSSADEEIDLSALCLYSPEMFEDAFEPHSPWKLMPNLTDDSSLINVELYEFLQASLPNIVKGCQWVLLYSTLKHGISLRTLIRRSADISGPALLIVGDRKGAVFGGLLDCPLKPCPKRKYQGTNHSFIFTTKFGAPRLFRATGLEVLKSEVLVNHLKIESEIAADALLDYVTFQILPENRYGACICSEEKEEMVGDGPLEQLLEHVPYIKDQIVKGSCDNFKLELPNPTGDNGWFTKATLMRFLHVIGSPDALNKFIAVSNELSQLEETRKCYLSLHIQLQGDRSASSDNSNEFSDILGWENFKRVLADDVRMFHHCLQPLLMDQLKRIKLLLKPHHIH